MDSLRGHISDHGSGSLSYGSEIEEETGREPPPESIGQDERRMQVRAYNLWASLLDNRNLPSVEDLDPGLFAAVRELVEAGRWSIAGGQWIQPEPTGADKTSLIAELPEDGSGALLSLLEQFSTRGINLSLIESRPIGDELGRYRFVIDADGHVADERMADALLGLRRFSPNLVFLGSYPRADRTIVTYEQRYSDEIFVEAREWLQGLLGGEPNAVEA